MKNLKNQPRAHHCLILLVLLFPYFREIIGETAVVITSPSTAYGVVNQPFDYSITTVGTPRADRFTANPLPPGLTVDQTTGVISGKPTTVGSYDDIVLTASNGMSSDAKNLNITITATSTGTGASSNQEIPESDALSWKCSLNKSSEFNFVGLFISFLPIVFYFLFMKFLGRSSPI